MTNEETMCCVSHVGSECVHSLTILSAHVDRLGRETDAELISAAARDIANIVMSLVEQFAEGPEGFTN